MMSGASAGRCSYRSWYPLGYLPSQVLQVPCWGRGLGLRWAVGQNTCVGPLDMFSLCGLTWVSFQHGGSVPVGSLKTAEWKCMAFLWSPFQLTASLLVFKVVTDYPSSRRRHIDLGTRWEECQGCIMEMQMTSRTEIHFYIEVESMS